MARQRTNVENTNHETPYYDRMPEADQTVQPKDLTVEKGGNLSDTEQFYGDGVKLTDDSKEKAKAGNDEIVQSLEKGEDTYSKEYALISADKVEENTKVDLVKNVESKGRKMSLVKLKAE